MARFKMTIEYVGTRYSGWQIQRNARTVQGEIAAAVRKVSERDDFELYGSGRTDAGVHALAQVAHLDLNTPLPPSDLVWKLNEELPADVNILAMQPVPRQFHARHDARTRRYLYQISRRRTAFAKPFVWWVRDRLEAEPMRAAATVFEGRHDFRSFTDQDESEGSTVVQLDRCEVVEDGDFILLRVTGSHFLWKMVRRMVGVLVEVGGTLRPADVEGFLRALSDEPARVTAPPSGLFLERVAYDGDTLSLPLVPVMSVGERVTPLPAARPAAQPGPRPPFRGERSGGPARGRSGPSRPQGEPRREEPRGPGVERPRGRGGRSR